MKTFLNVLLSMVLFVIGALVNRKAMDSLNKSGIYEKIDGIGRHNNNNSETA